MSSEDYIRISELPSTSRGLVPAWTIQTLIAVQDKGIITRSGLDYIVTQPNQEMKLVYLALIAADEL